MERDGASVLEGFWRSIETEGTPIVEPLPGSDDHLITFLWRDADGGTNNVVLEGGFAVSHDPLDASMARLESTDVWFKTYRVGPDLRIHYLLSPNDLLDTERWRERMANFRPDPFARHSFTWPFNPANPESAIRSYSVVELQDAPGQPWFAPRPGVPRGTVEEHRFRGAALGNERRVWAYLPAGSERASEPLPVLVLLDGWEWAEAMPIAPTLDNLIAEGRIPPIAALLVESLDYLTRGRELPCQDPFPAFLADELLPWARSMWHITDEPVRTIVAGQSYGGLAAAYASFTRPEVFGSAISQSGSFWWFEGWEDAGTFDGGTSGWLVREVIERPAVPVRLWLEVGSFEYEEDRVSNHAMRDALRSRGYDLSYRGYEGGHSWLNWRGSIADALIDMTG